MPVTGGPVRTPKFADIPEASVGNAEPSRTAMKTKHVSQPEDRHVAKSIPKGEPFLTDGDMLEVTNDDSVPVTFRWARKVYTVQPYETGFVIFEALVNALGDPRSVYDALVKYDDGNGNSGVIMDRYADLSRLFAMYGVEKENMDELVERVPKVVVRTMTGQRVNFPGQFPTMTALPTALVDPHHVNSDVTRMIDSVKAENADLRERLERMEAQMDANVRAREAIDEE